MILRRDQLTREQQDAMHAAFDSGFLVRPEPEFNLYGLRFDVQYLYKVGLYITQYLPVEDLAMYADQITTENVEQRGNSPLMELDVHPNKMDFTQYNATAVGNLAYVLLHHPKSEVRTAAFNHLEAISRYCFTHPK